MSDSNIGARKKKNIRNHSFIINGVINEILNNKNKSIDIEIVDYRQCFDSMWLEESINDLYEAGIQDDELPLIYKSDETSEIAVNTPFGITDRETVHKIVMQGEVLAPLKCSVQVDTIGKECIEEKKNLYQYKEKVSIPPLGMVDDIIAVSKCGVNSLLMNSFLNSKTNIKKLQFGTQKCHKLHIGKSDHLCPDLYIDSWKVESRNEILTNIRDLLDVEDDLHKMETVDDDKYLGDIISSDGKNSKNIAARKARGLAAVDRICQILEEICFGPFLMEVAVILRNSLLLSTILSNCESWYNLTLKEVEELESVDESLLQKILEAPFSTPKEMFFLEMGIIPIRFILMKRRFSFLHYILKEDKNSLIYNFFQEQSSNPVKGDWILTVKDDLEAIGIDLEIEEIEQLSEGQFKTIIDEAVEKHAFEYLIGLKNSHSKVEKIEFRSLEMQRYLTPSDLLNSQVKFIFQARTRMLNVKANYKNGNSDLQCRACNKFEENQPHLLVCEELNNNLISKENPVYEDIFYENFDKLKITASMLETSFKKLRDKC